MVSIDESRIRQMETYVASVDMARKTPESFTIDGLCVLPECLDRENGYPQMFVGYPGPMSIY